MELWVRSQDNRLLCKVDSLNCYKLNGSFNISTGNQLLGKYSTEERCLEIIDEIQKLIDGNTNLFITSNEFPEDTTKQIIEDLKSKNYSAVCNARDFQCVPLDCSITYQMLEN